MDTSAYDAKIQQAERQKADLYNEQEQLVAELTKAVTVFIENEYRKQMDAAITGKPEHTQSLGPEKLKILKAELKDAESGIPEATKTRMSADTLWEHRSKKPEELNFELAFAVEHHNSHASHGQFSLLLGELGRLLVKYGFAKEGKDEAWTLRDGEWSYRYYIPVDAEVTRLTKRYKELFKKYVDAHLQVLKLKTEREQAIARSLWDEA